MNGTLNAFLPLYGREVLGLTVTQLGWLFGVQTLTTLAVRPAIGYLSDRLGRRWVIVTGLAVCRAAVVLVSVATNVPEIVTAVLAYAAGVATTTAATSAYITDMTRRADTERHTESSVRFAASVMPSVQSLPVLVATVGYARMFQVMAAVASTMAAAFAVASRIGYTDGLPRRT